MRRLILLLSSLTLSGCVSNGVQALRPLEIATAPYSALVTAAPTGTLAYERGCLVFYDDSRNMALAPVWPDGTIFNGSSLIFHKPGRADQAVVLNQEFVLSGQPSSWSAVPGSRAALFQRQCGGTPFLVADVRPAN
jgi:hypothetical protein